MRLEVLFKTTILKIAMQAILISLIWNFTYVSKMKLLSALGKTSKKYFQVYYFIHD